MSQDGQGNITYKQALRGLFTVGTSTLMLQTLKTTEKVGGKQGLNSVLHHQNVPKHLSGAQTANR